MSYCIARARPAGSSGERSSRSPEIVVSSASSSGTTPLNGLCVASQRVCSASHLYIGKRWTQQYASSSASASPSRPPSSTRSRPEHVVGRRPPRPRRSRIRSPSAAPRGLADRRLRLGRQELRDGPVELAALGDREVDEPAGAEPLGELGQVVDLAARRRRPCPARRSPLTRPPRRERLVEHAEARRRRAVGTGERGREVDQLHREPDVRLVRPVALHRLRRTSKHRERDARGSAAPAPSAR